ncbi:MAG: rhomboid family intramembrane serine protease [Woeseiaceae bacterium]|nr:rhomboid family intramembrane serine protease [Woeseiaceae bacterium]
MRVVFESRNRQACADRALVLESLRIPYEIVDDELSCALVVPAEHSAEAAEQLRRYDAENVPRQPRSRPRVEYFDAVPGLLAYVLALVGVGFLAANDAFSTDWRGAGRVDGALVRAGEWWRTITALTLHSGIQHLVGNLIFGVFFGLFAGRLLGSGVAWLAILVAAAVGNALNTMLLTPQHWSIGASTAVFAALGIVAGHVWHARLMRQDRWPYRVGPVVGGLALLMYTGTGDANTDVGAHLFGFVCGFVAGMLLVPLRGRLGDERLQTGSALAAAAILVAAWLTALTA